MSFNTDDIRGMPEHYEVDYHTGMDTELIAGTVQFSDEKAAWMKAGYIEVEKFLISEKNTLFESFHDYFGTEESRNNHLLLP